jgi:peptidoglycan/xylan/chitin deacetylase (PgdA/CDA1 family)
MKKLIQWGFGLMTVALMTAFVPAAPFPSMADETASGQEASEIRNGWIDENLGPGVARWIDGNGNISEQPGKRTEEEAGEESQSSTKDQDLNAGTAAEEQQEAALQEGREQASEGRYVDPLKPMVALTFDDGPFAPVGNQIMDCLAQYGGKATFFVVGSRVSAYGAEMQRMAAEGHEIGNHTYGHKNLTKLSTAQIRSQINLCHDTVQAACGVRPALVRPPGGAKNGTVIANVQAPVIMWSIDTRDWKTRNAGKTVNSVLGQVRDGDIILMHELYSQSGAAALEIIPGLTEAGYQLVTVSEMAALRGGVVPGGVYFRFYP